MAPPESSQTDLAEFPPSAKLVVKVLEYEGSLTQQELAEQTRLPKRTVRDAVTKLEEQGYVESRLSFMDARQRQYTLVSDGVTAAEDSD